MYFYISFHNPAYRDFALRNYLIMFLGMHITKTKYS